MAIGKISPVVEKNTAMGVAASPKRVDIRVAGRVICNTESKCETGAQVLVGMDIPMSEGAKLYGNLTLNALRKFSLHSIFGDEPDRSQLHPQVFLQATPLLKISGNAQLMLRAGIGGDWLVKEESPTQFGLFGRIGAGLLFTLAKDPEGFSALLTTDAFLQNPPGVDYFSLIARATLRMTFNLPFGFDLVVEPRAVLNSAAPRFEFIVGPQTSFSL